MYRPVSPNRPVRSMATPMDIHRAMQDRSRSPIQAKPLINVSPQHNQMPIPNIVGNVYGPPPPGMQTVLKPKIFEAVEIPANQVPQTSRQIAPQYMPQPQQDPEQAKRIQSLEHELNIYRTRVYELGQIANNLNPEYEKLSAIIQDKSNEVEMLQQDKKNLQDQLRQAYNSTNQDVYEHQAKQLKVELEDQKRFLTQQCEQFFQQYQQSEQEKQELQMKIRQLESLTAKVTHLQHQNNEQNEKLNHMVNEISSWKLKYNHSEEERIRQIEHLRDEYERIYQQQYEGLKQSAENKCRMLEDEMERNRNQLNETIKEAESWRSKYHQEDLDKLSYNQKISQLELQNLHQQKDIDRLTLTNLQKQQEVEGLRQRINQLEYNHVNTLQPSLETELKRLREQMEARNKELDDLRKRNHELEQYCIKMKEVEVEYDILLNKYRELEKSYQEHSKFRHLYEQLQMEYEGLKQRLQKHEGQTTDQKRAEYRLQQEIQRQNDLLRLKDEELARQASDYKRNMVQLQNQVNQFKEQYDRDLQNAINNKNRNDQEFRDNLERKFNIMKEELESQRREREQLLQTCSQLSQTKIQLENKIVLLTGEIERLNQVIRSKYDEQQSLKDNYRLLNDQLEQSQAQIEELRKDSDNWRSRAKDVAPSYRSTAPRQFESRPYENSHKGSVSKPYDSQRQSQKQFDITSHQQDFS